MSDAGFRRDADAVLAGLVTLKDVMERAPHHPADFRSAFLARHEEVDLAGLDLQVAQAVGCRVHPAAHFGRRQEGLFRLERAGGDDGVAGGGDPDPDGLEAGPAPRRIGDLVALPDELCTAIGSHFLAADHPGRSRTPVIARAADIILDVPRGDSVG
ncbi:hypothetical protein [Streptomyces purpureus]|uniref:hypothetical protein n=1 Tax=Streptomyces purpureus TaxID=1951 RepID=UPI00068DBF51